MQICPSILEYKAEDYLKIIKKLSPYYQYFQIDFADGIYVDNKTASLDEFVDQFLSNNFKNFITLQTLKTLTFDFHFMVKNYEEYIKKINGLKKIINVKNIFVHYDLVKERSLDSLRSLGMTGGETIGLVLNPQDEVSDLVSKYDLNKIPFLQIMSIVPGAQGKPFMPETLNKVEQLRNLGYRKEIYLDGAVNEKTLLLINDLKYQPDFVCPGSFLTKSADDELKKRVDYLLSFKL